MSFCTRVKIHETAYYSLAVLPTTRQGNRVIFRWDTTISVENDMVTLPDNSTRLVQGHYMLYRKGNPWYPFFTQILVLVPEPINIFLLSPTKRLESQWSGQNSSILMALASEVKKSKRPLAHRVSPLKLLFCKLYLSSSFQSSKTRRDIQMRDQGWLISTDQLTAYTSNSCLKQL